MAFETTTISKLYTPTKNICINNTLLAINKKSNSATFSCEYRNASHYKYMHQLKAHYLVNTGSVLRCYN